MYHSVDDIVTSTLTRPPKHNLGADLGGVLQMALRESSTHCYAGRKKIALERNDPSSKRGNACRDIGSVVN